MPEDARFPFQYDESGDIDTVEGEDFYYRHALQLGLIASSNIKGNPVTRTTVIALQDRMARKMSNSPYFEPPVQVDIIETTDDEEIVAEVVVNNLTEFEIVV